MADDLMKTIKKMHQWKMYKKVVYLTPCLLIFIHMFTFPVKVRSACKIDCFNYHCHSSTAPSYVTYMLQKKSSLSCNTHSSSHTMPVYNAYVHGLVMLLICLSVLNRCINLYEKIFKFIAAFSMSPYFNAVVCNTRLFYPCYVLECCFLFPCCVFGLLTYCLFQSLLCIMPSGF